MSATGDGPAPNGFTLIEALVTLAIAVMVAGIGFPSIQRALDSWAFRSAALATASGISAARAKALLSGDRVQFVPAPDGTGFAVGAEPAQRFADGVRFDGAPRPVIFFADGSSNGGQLVLASARSKQSFLVTADTGLLAVGQ